MDPNARQSRFLRPDPDDFLKSFESLTAATTDDGTVSIGIAPHSVRAVPLSYLKTICAFASQHEVPVHIHVAEQPAEVSDCIAEYGRSPVALLASEGLLSDKFTAVHAVHVTEKAVKALADANAMVCACPTTERNLGDGVVPADLYFRASVSVCLGTDSQIQIDLLEDARELEYHLRLQKMQRAILSRPNENSRSALAADLFDSATSNGARSLGINSGRLSVGRGCDFFTVALDDPSIAGTQTADLLPVMIFSMGRSAIRDVVVNGKQIVTEGRHLDQDEIVARFESLQRKLWRDL
jgi:formimidoylglutamate deiminase